MTAVREIRRHVAAAGALPDRGGAHQCCPTVQACTRPHRRCLRAKGLLRPSLLLRLSPSPPQRLLA